MGFLETVSQVKEYLAEHRRVSLRGLRREFNLDSDALDDLVDELVAVQQFAAREGEVLAVLGADQVPTPVGEPTSQPSDAERRQITVMFVDLVGSTALSERLDPEDLVAILEAYQKACRGVLSNWDGFIARPLGDGLLTYFGYPLAMEDAPARAVRAGLEIVGSMPELNREFEGRFGALTETPLQVRVGIHTGLVVVGDVASAGTPEQVAVGETPNIAARLQGLAAPDEVVLSEATLRLVPGLFLTDDLGPCQLKGIAEPLRAHRALSATGMYGRLALNADSLTPLIGREEELALLISRWERACDGEGQVLLVSGEAGVGKSRLLRGLRDRLAADSHSSLEAYCNPHAAGSAFAPWIELLEGAMGVRPGDLADVKLRRLEEAMTVAGLAPKTSVPYLAPLLSLPLPPESYAPVTEPPPRRRLRTMEVMTSWVTSLAERQPLLLSVEDLHWCDASSLELIERLMDECATVSVLFLLTFRAEFDPPWGSRSHVNTITLARLRRKHAERLIGRVALERVMPRPLVSRILDRADGVPLFLEELTKMVLEDGAWPDDDARSEERSHDIPATLKDSLMARLDRLGEAKEVAQLAAVLGRDFSYEQIAAVASAAPEDLERQLDQLVEAEFLYQRNPIPHTRYHFKHALVQDMAYQSLLRSKRHVFHRRIAEVFEEKFEDVALAQPELLAHHYAEAGLVSRAIPFLERAGTRALERSALPEAIAHLSRGVDLVGALPESEDRSRQELALQVPLGTAYLMSRGYGVPEVGAAYGRARELSRELPESREHVPTLLGLFRFYMGRGDYTVAREIGEQLVTVASGAGNDEDRVLAHYAFGSALHLLGEIEGTLREMEAALALYDRDRHASLTARSGIDPGVTSGSVACHALWELGLFDRAIERRDQTLALARDLGHVPSEVFAIVWTGAKLSLFLREPEAVAKWSSQAGSLCEEHGIAFFSAMADLLGGWARSELGQPSEGVEQIERGLASLENQGTELFMTTWQALYAQALGNAGRFDEAFGAVARGLSAVSQNSERYWEAELYRVEGALLLSAKGLSAAAEAESRFVRAISVACELGMHAWELRAATSLAELRVREGRVQDARTVLSPLIDKVSEGRTTRDVREAVELLESAT